MKRDTHRIVNLTGKLAVFCIFTVAFVMGLTDSHAFSKKDSKTGCFEYGIPCDSLQVIKNVVKRNQNLAKILLAYNVPYATIRDVSRKSKEIFDVRKIKAGNPFCILRKPEPEKKTAYFIYEQDPVNYVVYDLGLPAEVYAGEKKTDIKIRAASCVIDSSLYQTIHQMGYGYEMVNKLSELYASTVDFHHLRKGDNFRLIFEEKYAGNSRIGLEKILAARFHHDGENYYAFNFELNGRSRYYDENGASLEKSFLKAPLKYTRITSLPSASRLHPILNIRKSHLGTDYAAPTGTPIHTVGDGVVLNSGYRRGCGNYVTIEHGASYQTEYLHMSKLKKGIRPGVHVNRGDVIGYVGSTGLATGPHLDFRFWKNGKIFNHHQKKLPSGKPLEKKYIQLFQIQKNALKLHLDRIPQCKTIELTKMES